MWIDAAWSARGLAALRAMLDVDDHTRRKMVQFLFDEGFWDPEKLTWDAAIARWNDCKNPGKSAFFKLGELWALALRFERHQLFLAMADNLGYEVRRIPTPERQQQLVTRLTAAMTQCEATLSSCRAELARINVSAEHHAEASPSLAGLQRFALDDDGQRPGGF